MAILLRKNLFFSYCLSLILTIASSFFIVACQSSKTTTLDSYSSTKIPRDFQLLLEEGGGFTGQRTGYLVDSSGNVISWRGIYPEKNIERTAKLDQQQFETLWQTIARARFFELDTTGSGNVTVAMQVSANGKVHRTSWEKPSGTQSPPPPVQVLYDSCCTLITRAK
jgi:hypothetical protein